MRPIALALACMGTSLPALAQAQLPSWNSFVVRGGSVAVGSGPGHLPLTAAGVPSAAGTILPITQGTQRAIIDWQGFSIGPGHAVNIAQPSASSVLLNRVTGNELSTIAGAMNANGRVFLVNPNGVLFANGSSVNVGGLVASSLKMATSDADFMAGSERLVFRQDGSTPGTVENRGSIRAGDGGTVALVGAQALNSGSMVAQGGTAGLVSADTVTVDFAGDGLTTFKVSPGLFGSASNSGVVQADGGRVVLMTAAGSQLAQGVVNTRGVLRADTLGARGGEIVLDSGASAGGVTINGGLLSAVGQEAGQKGGRIEVNGRTVLVQAYQDSPVEPGIVEPARIDASGGAGGGVIRVHAAAVGGDAQTGAIAVAASSRISADATAAGNGGDIRLLGERTLRAYGSLSAKGGSEGGNGGFMETSGGYAVPAGDNNGGIDLTGLRTDASAPKGTAGEWMIDPFDVTIVNGAASGSLSSNPFAPVATSTIQTGDINAALDSGTDVLITTGTGGAQEGNVTFGDAALIQRTSAGPAPVTFQIDANQNIVTTGEGTTIESTGGPLNVVLRAGTGGAGDINFGGGISAGGGNVSLNAGVGGGVGNITYDGTIATTGAGTVTLNAGAGGGDINYTGAINAINGAVTLNTGAAGGDIFYTGSIATIGGAVALTTGAGGGDIGYAGTINTINGPVSLTTGAGGGDIDYNGSISTTGGSVTLTTGDGGGDIGYNGTIATIDGAVTLTTGASGGDIDFAGFDDGETFPGPGSISTIGGAVTLTTGAGGGDINFNGSISTIDGAATLTTGAAGGDITYSGSIGTIGGAVALTTGAGGGDIEFAGPDDGDGPTDEGSISTIGGSVTLTTGKAGGDIDYTGTINTSSGAVALGTGLGGGDIDFFGSVGTAGAEVRWTVESAGEIFAIADITTQGGNVTIDAGLGGTGSAGLDYRGTMLTGGGNVTMRVRRGGGLDCTLCLSGGSIDTRVAGSDTGGAIELTATRNGLPQDSFDFVPNAVVEINDTTLRSGTGNVTISGIGGLGGSGVEIRTVEETTGIFTTSGNVDITGVGSAMTANSFLGPGHGVLIEGGAQVQSVDGNIAIRGLRLAGPSAGNGVLITEGGSVAAAGKGSIEITGQSQLATAGVLIEPNTDSPAGTRVVDGGGNVVLRAAGAGGVDALQILGNVHAGGVLDLRPGGVDAQGHAGDRVADAITLAGTANSGFAVNAAELARLEAGSIVAGSNLHAGPIDVLGPISMASPLTLQNGAGGGITLQAAVSTPQLGLLSGGNITQAPGASIVADRLLARSGGGDVLLNDPGNDVSIGTVGGGAAGRFEYTDANAVTLGSVPVTVFDAASNLPQTLPGGPVSADRVVVRTLSGDLFLGTDVSSTSGTDLVAAAQFQNTGNHTISGAPWRIWSASWTDEARGGLAGSGPLPNLYNCTYQGNCGPSIPADGNHFIYTRQPTARVVVNNASRPGGLANPFFTYSIDGLLPGDTGAGFIGTFDTPATRSALSGIYPINASFTSAEGYAVNVVTGLLTVAGLLETPRPDVIREETNTWLYDRNLRASAICLATGPLGGDRTDQDGDILTREWSRVRSRPNLTSCIDTERRNGCADF